MSRKLAWKKSREIKKQKCLETFKAFKRFLKEEGCFYKVMNYLFPPGRTFDNFIDDWIDINGTYPDITKEILNRVETLGPTYKESGYMYWYDTGMGDLAQKWNKRCMLHNFDYSFKIDYESIFPF